MKNALLKFAGLFVERVPVDAAGRPLPPGPRGAPASQNAPVRPEEPRPMQQHAAAPPPQQPAGMPMHGQQPGSFTGPDGTYQGAPTPYGTPIAVALRAWVPQEYAAHLAPFGVHVIAAGGSVTSEQARGWGAQVLVISAECLGQDLHLLQQPQLPTVLITPQPVMLPDVAGVLQVQEPIRASEVARAAREAMDAFAAGRG